MSDHSTIHSTLCLAKPLNIQVTTKSQSYKYVNIAAICEDIQSLLLSNHLPDDTNYAVDVYNETFVDKHTPWFNCSIRSQNCVRRQL